ncbi:MAG: hypothetical protein AABZ36_09670 [Nitrospirota bacterium]
MHDLIGKKVEVITFEIIYRGVLIEIADEELHLQSEYGWISVPLEKVAEVREVEE